jgi:hypothetical protein
MLTLEQVKDNLKDRITTKVAEATGLHYNTVLSIKNGTNKNPSFDAITRLVQYLENSK